MTKRILVVEDQEDNRRIIRDLLKSAGYDLIEAADGEAGVRLAESERPPRAHARAVNLISRLHADSTYADAASRDLQCVASCDRHPNKLAVHAAVAPAIRPLAEATRLEIDAGVLTRGLWVHALRLHEAGMITSSPNTLLAEGTDWRFVKELKRELKA